MHPLHGGFFRHYLRHTYLNHPYNCIGITTTINHKRIVTTNNTNMELVLDKGYCVNLFQPHSIPQLHRRDYNSVRHSHDLLLQ